ncbi:prolipoprotein diacylglyceryl transferase [uncultured Tyzzerella sp.]|uniref:prolipoprotein diacylglyceryl transferase n=1 Tax=uncultured Tyzzerella sp. TaxID=2321398 RepID=UPI002942F14F|nr:prolipoprotein diacylglyceryl transferase [uncultured Tyzzerella sp.]
MEPEIWFVNLGIKINHLDRVAFNVFGIDVYWYGVIIGFGMLFGLIVTLKEAKRTGQETDFYIDTVMISSIISILFARLYYVIFSWDYYKNHINEIFSIRNGGIAIYGAIIGAVLSGLIICKIRKKDFFKVADTFSFGILIGQIIGRWGNFVNREAFGGYTDSLFAMRYIKDQASNIPKDVLDKVVNINGVEYIQVHPTFLYESLWNIGVLIVLFIFRKHKKFNGQLMALYFIGYGLGRFWIEGMRTDSLMIAATNIRVSQVLSIILVVSFTIYLIIQTKKYKDRSDMDILLEGNEIK